MSHRTSGRHRAPGRLSQASTTLTRSAKVTAVAATSGGLMATAAVPASASPQTIVDEIAAVVGQTPVKVAAANAAPVVDALSVTLPALAVSRDKPAVAVAAPAEAEVADFGELGFTGVTPPAPEPEPVPEPTPEPQPAAESAQATESSQPAAASNEGSQASQGRADTGASRTETGASRTQERAAAPAPARAAAPAPASGGVLGVAAAYTGIPYAYAGSSPSTGFDCSGYTQFVFAQVGISLPRSAAGQQAATTPVSNPQPGDLVFWGYPAYHVGIYAGNGMIYDSGRPGLPSQLRPEFSGVTGYGRVG